MRGCGDLSTGTRMCPRSSGGENERGRTVSCLRGWRQKVHWHHGANALVLMYHCSLSVVCASRALRLQHVSGTERSNSFCSCSMACCCTVQACVEMGEAWC